MHKQIYKYIFNKSAQLAHFLGHLKKKKPFHFTTTAFVAFENSEEAEDASKWNNFVESIKSKLTVKQVVDGVRAGGSLSFDYLLLIVTAE